MNITNEEKNLLAKLASGALDGVVGEETPCAEYKGTYCGKYIQDGEPVEYWQVKPSRPIDKGIGRFDCKRSQKVYNTDEYKLEFLREYGWLMKDNDARQYSAKFRSEKDHKEQDIR